MEDKAPTLIQCADHRWAPYAIICVHLMTGESRVWEPIPVGHDDGREIDNDWLCPDCVKINEANQGNYSEAEIDLLRPVCIHCCRQLRQMYDPNFYITSNEY